MIWLSKNNVSRREIIEVDMKKHIQKMITGSQLDKYLLAAIVVSVLWSVIVLWPHLTDYYRVPIDTQNFYWMARFQDPELFPVDHIYVDQLVQIELLGIQLFLYPVSLGYGLLFHLASNFVSPILFGKLLIFFLMPVSVSYLYQIGKLLAGKIAGFFLGLFFAFLTLASPDSLSIASGLQRAFAIPLLIVFIYYLFSSKYCFAAILIPLSALLYLPDVPLLVLTYMFSLIKWQFRPFQLEIDVSRKKILPLLIALIVTLLIGGWALGEHFHLFDQQMQDELVKKVSIVDDPLHKKGGPVPMYLRFPWLGKAGIFDVDADGLNFLVLIVLSVLVCQIVAKERLISLPKVVWKLLFSGFLMYFLSLGAVFLFSTTALYLPSRYTRATLFFVPFMFVGLNLASLLKGLPVWLRKHWGKISVACVSIVGVLIFFSIIKKAIPSLLGWIGLTTAGLLSVLLPGMSFVLFKQEKTLRDTRFVLLTFVMLVSLIPAFTYSRLVGFNTINPTEHERNLYQYVATLPKDTMLAGSPEELTGIPLFSKRSVLFRSLFPDRSVPIVPSFDAYYAESAQTVLNFCEVHHIDYLVYNIKDFDKKYLQTENFFYQPYNQEIKTLVSNRNDFVLPQAEQEFSSGPLGVIKCLRQSFAP
jgi:hypothetical protein